MTPSSIDILFKRGLIYLPSYNLAEVKFKNMEINPIHKRISQISVFLIKNNYLLLKIIMVIADSFMNVFLGEVYKLLR